MGEIERQRVGATGREERIRTKAVSTVELRLCPLWSLTLMQ